MDRNSLIGLLLIGIILIMFTIYNAPTQKQQTGSDTTRVEQTTQQTTPDTTTFTTQDTPTTPSQQTQTATSDTSTIEKADTSVEQQRLQQKKGIFADAILKAQQLDSAEQFVKVENQQFELTFSKKGGKLVNVRIKNYSTYHGDSLILFNQDSSRFGYTFYVDNKPINTGNLYFEPSASELEVGKEEERQIKFRSQIDDDKYLEHIYTITGEGHQVDYQFNFVGFDDVLPKNANYLTLNWETQLRSLEKGKYQENTYTTLYYKYSVDDDVTYQTDGSAEVNNKLEWIAYNHQFFNTTLIREDGFLEGSKVSARKLPEESPHLKTFQSQLYLPYRHKKETQYNMQFYIGPNHYNQLAGLNNYLEEIIPLGWAIFGWINKYFIIPFFNFLNSYVVSYGIIIFLMTIIIKSLLMPLTYKSYLSMAKMKVIKPELEELKEKYKDKPQKFSQAQLKLFRKAGVNPLGGCLPMLLQMPILVAMYRFFPASIELRQESFLWAEDLSTYDSIMELPFSIPFYGDHISLFTLLMAVSMLAYTRMNSQMTSGAGPGGGQMKMMQYFMPVFMLFIFNSFSAALTYYFLLSNLFSFGQQYFMKKFLISDEQVHKSIEQQKKKPKKKSKLQKKLEQMTKDKT
jgi:YidC/Oxa1 family membrane protein insertase